MKHSWYWLSRFKADAHYGKMRLKKLDGGYPRFDFDSKYIDTVRLEVFIKNEPDRIPLFIGTQFGVMPRVNELQDFFNGPKEIAVLGKSLLSGTVAGLGIYLISEEDAEFTHDKVKYFPNDKL